MRLKTKSMIAILMISLGLTACTSTPSTPKIETETKTTQTIKEEAKKESIVDKLTVDGNHTYGKLTDYLTFDVTNPDLHKEVGEHAIVPVKTKAADADYIVEKIFGKKVNPKITKMEDDTYKEYQSEKSSLGQVISDSDQLGGIYYFTDFMNQTNNIFHYNMMTNTHDPIGDTTNYFETDKDLSFAPVKNVKAEVVDLLEKAGYDFNQFPLYQEEVFSLTKESLKKAEDFLAQTDWMIDLRTGKSTVKGNWTTDDEAYYLYLHTAYDGLPLYEGDHDPSQILYNKDKIVGLTLDAPLEVISTNLEKKPLISFEEALNIFLHYGASYDDEKITDMNLCYYPKNTENHIELIPVWHIEWKNVVYSKEWEKATGKDAIYRNVFINAITGEWSMDEM
ncbi:hypothetical protein P261_01439 [Lachnospiraceae bacterium TWA4]|nr:hypothetical protein P261_01439 [Lachnospiraceae bacterium TWA4]